MSILHHTLHRHPTLAKTASYYVVHIVVAVCVAFAVTGNWHLAMTLSLLEPTVQAGAFFLHEQLWARLPLQRARTLVKTATYYVMHITVAAAVAYSVTGDLWAALGLSLLEPTVQMLFFYGHEKLWARYTAQGTSQPRRAAPSSAATGARLRVPAPTGHCRHA